MAEALKPIETIEPRPTDPELSRYVRAYMIQRFAVGVLGIALPILLVLIDGLWFDTDPFLRTSISSYYYSGVRDLFVGTMCAIGVFLITYKVAERNLDNTLSLVAGGAAVVVALFPTGLPSGIDPTPLQERLDEAVVEWIHYIFAAAFIGSLAVISWFFGKREGNRTPAPGQRRSRKFWRVYHQACAAAIGVALAWIGITEMTDWGSRESLLYGEAAAVWAFGLSWLMKGAELDILLGRK
jgi:hypothetical protein